MYIVAMRYMRQDLSVLEGSRMSLKSDVRVIVLDIDGTLCSLTHGVGSIYHELLRARGIESDRGVLEAEVRRVWGSFHDIYLNTTEQYRTTHEREREVWLEFVRRVCAAANLSCGSDPVVVESIYNAFATRAYRRVQEGAMEFLLRAREQGRMVVAASNNDARSKLMLEELGLHHYLAHIFVAGDLGWKKPSPHFYATLAARLHLEPSNILHVGNDRELDVEAAKRAGLTAIHYAPRGEAAEAGVTSFKELTALVGL